MCLITWHDSTCHLLSWFLSLQTNVTRWRPQVGPSDRSRLLGQLPFLRLPRAETHNVCSTTTKADDVVTTLTVLIDATSWKAFPGDPDLIAALMSLLSALSNKQPTINEGAEYLQQEILGALHILIEKVQDPQDIQRAQVSVDVIIKVIRGELATSPDLLLLIWRVSLEQPTDYRKGSAGDLGACNIVPGRGVAPCHADFHLHGGK